MESLYVHAVLRHRSFERISLRTDSREVGRIGGCGEEEWRLRWGVRDEGGKWSRWGWKGYGPR